MKKQILPRIKLLQDYGGMYKAGEIIKAGVKEAQYLVTNKQAVYVDVEHHAPRNKEIRTARKVWL